jgi:hypothetical protein
MAETDTCGVAGGQPFWRKRAKRPDRWRDVGASEYEVRAIRFGILDLPSVPFTYGFVLPVIPQSEEDLRFGRADLRVGCASEIYEELGASEVREVLSTGRMVSSAFTLWQGERYGTEGKVRDQICAAEPALATRIGEDGDEAGVCVEPLEVRVPALLHTSADAGLLLVSLWRALLSLHRVAIRLGAVRAMVYEADAACGRSHQERVGIPGAALNRRIPLRTQRWTAPRDGEGLSARARAARAAVRGPWA